MHMEQPICQNAKPIEAEMHEIETKNKVKYSYFPFDKKHKLF